MSGLIAFQIVLFIRVLEWLVILAGCNANCKNELKARETKKFSVWL